MDKSLMLQEAWNWLSANGYELPAPLQERLANAEKRKRIEPKQTGANPEHSRRRRPSAGRHNRKCNVCRHAERDAIEQDFLSWHSPDRIAEDYRIADHSSIYRHAHATGLFTKRAQTIRVALAPILERAEFVKVTGGTIVRAIALYARLNAVENSDESDSNRQGARLEHDATR